MARFFTRPPEVSCRVSRRTRCDRCVQRSGRTWSASVERFACCRARRSARRFCSRWPMATRTSKLLIWLVGVRATRCWPWSVCSIARGLAALEPRHAGGPAILYDAAAKERILTEFRRKPDRVRDGTATWSLTTLQRALRRAADGLPSVSTHTIWCVLHEAGLSWQRDRSWCQTGVAIRKRKNGEVEVH